MNRKRIVFCLPGKNFSGNFLVSWTKLIDACVKQGIDVILSQRSNSNVYFVRSQCLGADVLRGKNQKPWNGSIPYDYIMWIDSDQVFEPHQFFKLLSHDKDIVGGLYLMDGGRQFPTIVNWDEEYFKSHGTFEFLNPGSLPADGKLLDVVYNGFGFMLIKNGVFEKITYPWFEPRIIKLTESIQDFASEDVSFCLKARDFGYKIYVDPSVVVGHEKSNIINLPTQIARI